MSMPGEIKYTAETIGYTPIEKNSKNSTHRGEPKNSVPLIVKNISNYIE